MCQGKFPPEEAVQGRELHMRQFYRLVSGKWMVPFLMGTVPGTARGTAGRQGTSVTVSLAPASQETEAIRIKCGRRPMQIHQGEQKPRRHLHLSCWWYAPHGSPKHVMISFTRSQALYSMCVATSYSVLNEGGSVS